MTPKSVCKCACVVQKEAANRKNLDKVNRNNIVPVRISTQIDSPKLFPFLASILRHYVRRIQHDRAHRFAGLVFRVGQNSIAQLEPTLLPSFEVLSIDRTQIFEIR